MTTKHYFNELPIMLLGMLIGLQIVAKPMDTVAAEKLPGLKAVAQNIRIGNPVATQAKSLLRECLKSKEPVLVSIASWCVLQLGEQGDDLYSDLPDATSKIGDLAQAFVTLAKEGRSLSKEQPAKRAARYRVLIGESNPYLRVESAKLLIRLDKSGGKAALEQLAQDKASKGYAEVVRVLRSVEKTEGVRARAPIPSGDELYATVLSVIE